METDTAGTAFRERVTAERQALGWSFRRLAAETGVSASMLHAIEHGSRPPSRGVVEALCEVFGLGQVETAALLLLAGYAPPQAMTTALVDSLDLIARRTRSSTPVAAA